MLGEFVMSLMLVPDLVANSIHKVIEHVTSSISLLQTMLECRLPIEDRKW